MTILILILLGTVSAQTPSYIDLSGEWRYTTGDDPRFRDPQFDDGGWRKRTVPIGVRALALNDSRWLDGEYFWLRRTVDVQHQPGGEPLALTLGAFSEAYEVFVNGVLIGRTGPFDLASLQLARPRIFPLPQDVHGPRLLIAIRAWNPVLHGWRGLIFGDIGPWLLTTAKSAPHDAGIAAIYRQRSVRLADLVQPTIVLLLAVIVLLIWAYERSQAELGWLGLYLVLIGGFRLHNYLQLTPDSHPFEFGNWKVFLGLIILPAAVLARFVASSLELRWLVWPVWAIGLAGAASIPWSEHGAYRALWAMDAITLAGLVSTCRPGRPAGSWRGSPKLLLVSMLAFIIYSHTSGWGRLERLGIPGLSLVTYPFTFSTHLTATTLFAFGFSIVLVRRLLRDRDEKVRLTGELEAARTVQQLLLPASGVTIPGYDEQAVYEPAQEVGGDFHWRRVTPEGSLLVVVGDVSGKGLRAAMLVSVAVGVLRNEKSDSPARVLAALNDSLVGHTGGGFITCCCVRFDPDGRVTMANAGHLAPVARGAEVAVEPGLPLGLVAGTEYAQTELRMDPGDQLTLVSDGVVEAANQSGELFGFDRTRGISNRPAREIAQAAKAWGQNDDITVVTVLRMA